MITICSYSNPLETNYKDGNLTMVPPTTNKAVFQFGSSTCIGPDYSTSTQQSSTTSSTAPLIFNGFSYGEIVSSVLLFLIFSVLFYKNLFE